MKNIAFIIILGLLLAAFVICLIYLYSDSPISNPVRYLRSIRTPECAQCAFYVIFPNKCRRAAAVDWYNRRHCTNDRIVPVEDVRGCSGCIFSSAEEHGYVDPKSREGEWNSVNGASR